MNFVTTTINDWVMSREIIYAAVDASIDVSVFVCLGVFMPGTREKGVSVQN